MITTDYTVKMANRFLLFFFGHTCLLGCGWGTDSSTSSSFDSARTGGRQKLMSSSIPPRTGAGSNAETSNNSPLINFIYIVKILTWLGCEIEVYTRCQRLSIQSHSYLYQLFLAESNTNMRIKPILLLPLPYPHTAGNRTPHNLWV